MMNKKRMDFLDYAKAIVIISVAMEHIGCTFITNFSVLGMVLLYISSGYTFSDKQKPLKEMIFSRFKRLILPFWWALAVMGVFEIWRAGYFHYADFRIAYCNILFMIYGSSFKVPLIPGITDVVYEIYPDFQLTPGFVSVITPTNCHLWTLPAMFIGYVIFVVYMRYVKKRGIWDVAAIAALLWFTYVESLPTVAQFPFGFGRGCMTFACMMVGAYLKKYELFTLNKRGYSIFVASLVLTVVSYFLDAFASIPVESGCPYGTLWGVYLNLVASVAGSFALLFLFRMLEEKMYCRLLAEIGKNTMSVYLWHLLFLTIYSLMFAKIFGFPIELFRFHMCIISLDHVWILTAVVVLSIASCMLLAFAKTKLLKLFKERKRG